MAKTKTTRKSSKKAAPAKLGADTRICVLYGPDEYLRSLRTDELKTALVESHGEVDVFRFDGASASVADVLDECRSMGLMMQPKLVIVDEADQFVKEGARPLMERYAEAPAEQATLVLRGERWNKGKLDKLIEKCGAIVKCDALPVGTAVIWVIKRADKRHELAFDQRAAELLVLRVGTMLGRLDAEVQKLASAAKAQGAESIDLDLVEAMVEPTAEEQAWKVQDGVLGGSVEDAVGVIRQALGPWRCDPVPVSWALVDLSRKLHAAAALHERGVPEFQIGKELRLWGPSSKTILRLSGEAGRRRCAQLFDYAVATDRGLKSGAPDVQRSLETLAARFASLGAGADDTPTRRRRA
ncbi:MAG: DNA polymerase III subunit delta [Phycisphaerales bacterium]